MRPLDPVFGCVLGCALLLTALARTDAAPLGEVMTDMGVAGAVVAQPGALACPVSEWGPVRAVAETAPAALQSLALAAGVPWVVTTQSDADAAGLAIVVRSVDGRVLPALRPGAPPIAPRVYAAPNGALRVVWAEERAGAESGAPQEPTTLGLPRSLWTAWYAAGRWSTPRRIYAAPWVNWGETTAAPLVADAVGTVHLAVGADPDPGPASAVIHVRMHGDSVAVTERPIYGATHYTSIAIGTGGSIRIAYVAPDSSERGHPATVFLLQKASATRSWESPILLSQMPGRTPTELRLLETPEGALTVVWGQSEPGDVWATSLVAMHSPDRGRSWKRPALVSTEGVVDHLRVARDGCGHVQLVGRRQPATGGAEELVHATLTATGWTAPAVLAAPYGGLGDLQVGADGRLLLVWQGVRDGQAVLLSRE